MWAGPGEIYAACGRAVCAGQRALQPHGEGPGGWLAGVDIRCGWGQGRYTLQEYVQYVQVNAHGTWASHSG